MSDTKDLTKLWNQNTKYLYEWPSVDILETFDNLHKDNEYLVPFHCTEFTSLCPKTGQPDFAEFHIMYIPDERMIESKSLKLYLFAFRQSWEFHEDITNRITKDIINKINPRYIYVYWDFTVRGWIAIKPMVEKVREDVKDIELEWYRFKVWQYLSQIK